MGLLGSPFPCHDNNLISVGGGREGNGTRHTEGKYPAPGPIEGGLKLAKNIRAPSGKHQHVLGASHGCQVPAQRRRGRLRRYRTGHKKPTLKIRERLNIPPDKLGPSLPAQRVARRSVTILDNILC
jgi:hypothetical protein